VNSLQEYDAMLADDVRDDYRYEFRVFLIPQTGPKTEADVAMRFVRLEDLPEEQRDQLEEVRTVVRDRQVPVSNVDKHRPGYVCSKISETLGVKFTPSSDHVRAWKHYKVRPTSGAANPARPTRGTASGRGARRLRLPDIQTDLAPTQGGNDMRVDSGVEAAASND
jgi:hypothetical protein